jgi:hypothetical protein
MDNHMMWKVVQSTLAIAILCLLDVLCSICISYRACMQRLETGLRSHRPSYRDQRLAFTVGGASMYLRLRLVYIIEDSPVDRNER